MAGREMAPRRSARDLFGAELRSWRRRNGVSHASLAQSVHCSASQIGRIEQSDRWPSKDLAVACDTALGTGGALARLWPAVEEQRRQEAADQPARHTADKSAGDRDRPDQHPAGDPTSDVGVVGVPAGDAPAWTGAWPQHPGLAAAMGIAYRREGGAWPYPDNANSAEDQAGVHAGVKHEVIMTAHGSSEHAEHAERRDIGEATLEQLRAEITRLSREFVTGQPFVMFRELRRVRDRIHAALDRRLWPPDESELYFLLGCLSDLMACAAKGLGCPQAAQELLRAGWAYAVIIDHRPLMAHLRLEQAHHAYWNRQPRQSRSLAVNGLEYVADGQDAAALYLVQARATASLGDAETARRAIAAAHEAREREHHDDLLEIGGEFGLSRASQHYLAGSTLAEIPDAGGEAITELEHATEMYAAGPEPGEDHHYAFKALAHIDLAATQLRNGALDAAAIALEPVLALPTAQRIDEVTQRLGYVRRELAAPAYRGQMSVADLDERIEDFARQTGSTGIRCSAARCASVACVEIWPRRVPASAAADSARVPGVDRRPPGRLRPRGGVVGVLAVDCRWRSLDFLSRYGGEYVLRFAPGERLLALGGGGRRCEGGRCCCSAESAESASPAGWGVGSGEGAGGIHMPGRGLRPAARAVGGEDLAPGCAGGGCGPGSSGRGDGGGSGCGDRHRWPADAHGGRRRVPHRCGRRGRDAGAGLRLVRADRPGRRAGAAGGDGVGGTGGVGF